MIRTLLLVGLCGCCFANQAAAQARYVLNYQGELRSASGDPLFPNSAQNITFKLYSAPTGGSPLYTETVNSVPIDANGGFNTNLGGSGTFVNHFSGGDRYLQITVAGNDILPRQLVTGTPYAFAAQNLLGNIAASKITSGTINSSRIPGLPASKITSGRFVNDRLPTTISANQFKISDKVDLKLRSGGGELVLRRSDNFLSIDIRADTGGTILAQNSITTTTVNETSDARLKEDLEPLKGALNRIGQLQGYTYDLESDFTDQRKAGILAQDVEKVLPEAVGRGKDGMLTVQHSGVVSLLVEAVKELREEVENQDEEINELKELIKTLNR